MANDTPQITVQLRAVVEKAGRLAVEGMFKPLLKGLDKVAVNINKVIEDSMSKSIQRQVQSAIQNVTPQIQNIANKFIAPSEYAETNKDNIVLSREIHAFLRGGISKQLATARRGAYNLIRKAQETAGTLDFYKVYQAAQKRTLPMIEQIMEKMNTPEVQQDIAMYKQEKDIATKIWEQANKAGEKHITLANMTQFVKEGYKDKAPDVLKSKAFEDLSKMVEFEYGGSAKISDFKNAIDVFGRTLSAVSQRFKELDNYTKQLNSIFGKELKNFEPTPGAQFIQGFTRPFSKIGGMLGISPGMPISAMGGAILGTGALFLLFKGIQTLQNSFKRFSEVAPLRTQVAMPLMTYGFNTGQYTPYSTLSPAMTTFRYNMAQLGIREPAAMKALVASMQALPSQQLQGTPQDILKNAASIISSSTLAFKTAGIDILKQAPNLIPQLQSLNVIENSIKDFNNTKFGKELFSILRDTKLIGTKQLEFTKSFSQTLSGNFLNFATPGSVTGLLQLSKSLLSTGIPALQGRAPEVAERIALGLGSMKGQLSPFVLMSAQGNDLWERYKYITNPANANKLFQSLYGRFGGSTWGKLLMANELQSFGLPPNLATQIVELYGKKQAGTITKEELQKLNVYLNRAYQQTPEYSLNRMVQISESILTTLEDKIAGNVTKMAAALVSQVTGKNYYETLSADFLRQVKTDITKLKKEKESNQITIEEYNKKRQELLEKAKSYGLQQTQIANIFGLTPEEAKQSIKPRYGMLGWIPGIKAFGKWLTNRTTNYINKNAVLPPDFDSNKVPVNLIPGLDYYHYNTNIGNLGLWNPNYFEQWEKGLGFRPPIHRKPIPDVPQSFIYGKTTTIQDIQTQIKEKQAEIDRIMKNYAIDKYSEIPKLNDEIRQLRKQLEKLIQPNNQPTSNKGNINITINIDSQQAGIDRFTSTENMYAKLPDLVAQALKNALDRASLYDSDTPLGINTIVGMG